MGLTNILYIEDDDAQRTEFTSLLESRNFNVFAAASGKEGLRIFRKRDIDVVLCDLNMPQMDGLQVLTEIQKLNADIPFIILTGHGSIPLAVKAMQQGAYHFALKPFEINDIVLTIEQAIEKFRLKRELRDSESTLKTLIENVPDIIFSLDSDDRFIRISPAVHSILGYEPDELVGRSFLDIVYEEDRPTIKKAFDLTSSKNKDLISLEIRFITKSGAIKDFELRRRLFYDSSETIRNIGIAFEITDRKKMQQALEKHSQELEDRVQERTERLEVSNIQLAALNAVANQFSRIYDEHTLIEKAPALLAQGLQYEISAVYLKEENEYRLHSFYCDQQISMSTIDYFENLRKDNASPPSGVVDSIDARRTIFLDDPDKIKSIDVFSRLSEIPNHYIAAPFLVKGDFAGFIEAGNININPHMDRQNIARFEMFANMIGLALDNIRSYQSLEARVKARTESLRQTNDKLRSKAEDLEKATIDLARANIDMLAIQEELEEKNAESQKLLTELTRSKRELQAILDSSDYVIVMVNSEGNIITTNKQLKTYFGLRITDILNKPFSYFTEKIEPMFEDTGRFKKRVSELSAETERVMAKQMDAAEIYRNACRVKGETPRYISLFSGPVRDEDEQLLGKVWIFSDITKIKLAEETLRRSHEELEKRVQERTKELAEVNEALRAEISERKQTEAALRTSEAHNRALLNAIPDLIFRLDKDGTYLAYHSPEGSFLAIPQEEVVGKNICDTLPPQLAKQTLIHINKALAKNTMQIFEYQLPHKEKMRDFEARIVVSGKEEVLSIVRDITEQKRAREELKKARDQLEIRVKERTAELAKTNEALLEEINERIYAEKSTATRLRYEEGLAACSQALLKYDNMSKALVSAIEGLREAANAGRVYIYENFEHSADKLSMRKLYETSAANVDSDIEKPSPAHIPYKNGFQRWQKILSRGDKISGKVKNFPEGEKEMLSSKNVLSILVLPIMMDNNWFGFIGFDNVQSDQSWNKEDIRLLKTASEMIGSYISRRSAADALKVSEARFRSLVENAHDVIYSMKPDGTFTYLSPQFKQLSGYDESDFLGKTMEGLIHPDDFKKTWQKWLEFSRKKMKQVEFEYRIIHKDGHIRWFTTHSTNILDEDGEIIESIGIAHDLTELKKVMENLEKTNQELRTAQAQLVQTEKMASLGMLVAGIAHEINTPTGAVKSMHNTLVRAFDKMKSELQHNYSDILENNATLSKTFQAIENANTVIRSGTERVVNIVRRLRSFARLDEAELKEVDIHEGLDDTLALIYHEIKHNVNIIKNYGDLPKIACYPGHLNQVFLNILINAAQAISDKGEIEVTTFLKDKKIYIKIRDNGSGISKENLHKIFDPGFTTKGVRIGTGLGLSICYQIMKDHYGDIEVESEIDVGTTFTLILPSDLGDRLKSKEK
ncbi:PAS domain S-box protein [candidate division KSB1 bacterium]|nr:PAS domain S-box protein [candidate division KSB1 bacterium]